MGAYYQVVNPAKRQFIDLGRLEGGCKRWDLMKGMHARALGLLLCDDRRVSDWPASLFGSWAGDTVVLPNDEEGVMIVDKKGRELLRYGIETRTATNPDRNLWWLAEEEYEEMSGAMVATLAAVDPSVFNRVPEMIAHLVKTITTATSASMYAHLQPLVAQLQRICEDRQSAFQFSDLNSPYPADEAYLVVNPRAKQYINPAVLGERATLDRLFCGWHGLLVGDMILDRYWEGPVYAAGELSAPDPPGVTTSTPEAPHRNLYATALRDYSDATYLCAQKCQRLESLISEGEENEAILIALGNLVFHSGERTLRAAMNSKLGVDWPKRYAAACRRQGVQ